MYSSSTQVDLLCAAEHWTICWAVRGAATEVNYIIVGLALKKLLPFGGRVGRQMGGQPTDHQGRLPSGPNRLACQRARLLSGGRSPPRSEACELSTSGGVGFDRQGMRAGSSRLRAWLERRHGRRKIPLCLGESQQAGVVGIQYATGGVVGGEEREVGWRVGLSHTGACG